MDTYSLSILLFLVTVILLSLVLVYICAIGFWKGVSAGKSRVLVVVIGLLFLCLAFENHVARREDNRMNYDLICMMMETIPDAIHSGKADDAAAILKEKSDQMTEEDWKIHSWDAVNKLVKLTTNNDAAKDAKKQAKTAEK